MCEKLGTRIYSELWRWMLWVRVWMAGLPTSWTPSSTVDGLLGGREVSSRQSVPHVAIPAPNPSNAVGSVRFLSFGTKGRSHSWTAGSLCPEGKHGGSIYRRRGGCLNSGSQRIGLNAGFKGLAISEKAAEERVGTDLPKGASEEDAGYMRMAVQLARKAIGHTSPNPMVGCVIVKDGQIIGRGFHPKAGEPHAEVFALREAGDKAKGATAYVTLEPCNHTGRTPPCSEALVRAKVKRVVVGTLDPNPLVGGKGVQTLKKAGIEVLVGVEEVLCQATAETFFHRITAKKPFVTLRYRMSLDGALLGSSEDRTEVGTHSSLLFQEHDAVVITDACVYDDPNLLSSELGAKQPLRVVLAKSLDLPLESKVFDTTHAPTLVVTDASALHADVERNRKQNGMSVESSLRSKGVDVVVQNEANLDSVLDLLYQRGFNSVLLDSRGPESSGLLNYLGPTTAQKLVVIIQPVIAGTKLGCVGFSTQDQLLRLERVLTTVQGGSVILEGYFQNSYPE